MSACQDLWTPNESQWRSCHPSGHEGQAKERATASTNKLSERVCFLQALDPRTDTPTAEKHPSHCCWGNDPAGQAVFDKGVSLGWWRKQIFQCRKQKSEMILEIKEITTKKSITFFFFGIYFVLEIWLRGDKHLLLLWSSIPSTHIGSVTTACKPGSRERQCLYRH